MTHTSTLTHGSRLAVLAIVAIASPALAQLPRLPMPAEIPGEPLPPPRTADPVPADIPLAPPLVGEAVPYPFSSPVPSGSAVVYDDSHRHRHTFSKPLPGSLDDNFTRDYVAREGFRTCAYGCPTTLFPTTLLWEPPLAIFREPRFALYAGSDGGVQNFGFDTIDTSIGTIHGLVRIEPPGSGLIVQGDIFGVVHTRWDGDDPVANSYRFGIPVTFRRGPWQAKIGYEHTTDTLGDRFNYDPTSPRPVPTFGLLPGLPRPRWERDEIVLGLGRVFNEQLRVYGQLAYAALLDWPTADTSRTRYDIGFEWYIRCPTGWAGTPFVAGNVNCDGVTNYEAGYTIQGGWLWRNPEMRLAQGRVFVQYANGRSPFAPFAAVREDALAFGISGDY